MPETMIGRELTRAEQEALLLIFQYLADYCDGPTDEGLYSLKECYQSTLEEGGALRQLYGDLVDANEWGL